MTELSIQPEPVPIRNHPCMSCGACCAIFIVMALFGLYSVFFGLPKGKRKGPSYDVASTYLKLIRNGGLGTLAYWAIPILLLVFVGVLSGGLWLVLAFVGIGASKKYFGETP